MVIGFTATPYANDPDGFARLFYHVVHGPPAYPGLGGGFTYALDLAVPDLGTTLQTWASAVAGALAGTAPPAAVAWARTADGGMSDGPASTRDAGPFARSRRAGPALIALPKRR